MFRLILLAISMVTSLFALDRQVKFCLLMFTQDQDRTIRDCFQSVKSFVDAVCVIDMGSSDWTNAIIEEFIERHNLPGAIFLYEKRGMAPQAFALEMGRTFLKETGFSLSDTYFLLLNADMTLNARPGFEKNDLDQDSYLIFQKSFSLGYSTYDVHLIRASLPWEYTPVAHTTWGCHQASDPVKLFNLLIEEGDTRLDQEMELITDALIQDSENNHYLFLFAQCCRAKKEYERAISFYTKRIERKGDFEELWLSQYMIGSCYEALNKWDKALYWYLEAFRSSPNRPDPIHKIASHYRRKGKNQLAYLFAKHGSNIVRVLDQTLFDCPPFCDYEFDEEISIAAYYTPFKQDGFFAASDLLLKKNVPEWVRNQNGRNLFFYDVFLQNANFQPIGLDLPLIEEGCEEKYYPMTSSIVKTDKGYKLICGAVNYTQIESKIFHTVSADGVYRTKNFFVLLDQHFNILSQKEMTEELSRERFPACNVEGLEDVRLFEWDGLDWLVCTTTDTNPTGNRQVSLCKLSEDRSREKIAVEQLVPLKGPNIYQKEKNWLPFIYDGQLYLIYSYAPLTLYSPSLETGESEVKKWKRSSLDFSHLRGSAAPISWDGGYLMLVHEVVSYLEYSKAYLHRFIFLNKDFEIEKISRPFAFLHEGIERCSSMTVDHSEKKLILPIGIGDCKMYFCSLPIESVQELLLPLPRIGGDPF